MRRISTIVFVISLLSGCAGSTRGAATPPAAAPVAVSEPQPELAAPPVSRGTLERAMLLPVLDDGLGRFLQSVETEPALADGRFVGFRVTVLRGALAEGIDLTAGDVVVRVNGQSIERPEHALVVWNGLRVASELWVEYVRGAERRELRFAIVD
jgi:hypothetical protein